jgi:hypothetical protein
MCDSSCPDGQYISYNENPFCMRCDARCLTCNVTNCFTCALGYNIPPKMIRCVLNCPSLNYYDMDANKCKLCYSSCYSCFNYT